MLQQLTDNTGRPVLYVDAGHVVRFSNRPFQQWVGMPESDVVNVHASVIFAGSGYDFYRPFLDRALAGETCTVETVSHARKDGARHVRISFFPDTRTDGSVAGIFIIALDIEDDYRLRLSLIEKEQELRAIADNIGMPLSKSDRNLRYIYINRVTCDWFGLLEGEIVGRTWQDLMGDRQFNDVKAYAERALAGEIVTYERYATYPEHPPGRIRVTVTPYRDHEGEVAGVYTVVTDVEQDHRLKQEIIDRERQLRLITDNIGLPISYIRADETIGFYNKTGEEWNGIAEQDVLGKSVQEAFGEDVVGFVRPYLDKALAGEHVSYERLGDYPSRGLRWVRGHMVPDRREDGRVAGVYTVLTDIHDDVVMRDNLLQQERQLRLFTDNIPESIAYIDTGRRYKFVNNTFLRQRGKSRHEVIGRTTEEVLGVEAARLADPHVAKALAGQTVTYERLVISADGQQRWFNVRTVPDMDRFGQVQGLYVVGMDIHDIKMAQATLESNEAELRSAMDSLPYPMVYVDSEYKYRMVNKRLEAMLGKSREELLGKDLREVFGDSRFAEVMPYWERALAGETISAERLIGTDPATQRWMIVRYTPRLDAEGKDHRPLLRRHRHRRTETR